MESVRDMSVEKYASQLNHLVDGKKVQVGAFANRGPAFDATSVVFVDPDKPGVLVEITHATKARVTLARDLGEKSFVAELDAKNAYVVTADAIKQIPPRTPGPIRTVYTRGKDDSIRGIALDAQHLWVVLAHSAVRVSLADGSVTPLADGWAPLEGYLLGGNSSSLVLLLLESKRKSAKRAIARIEK